MAETALFACQECGRKFKTVAAARRASYDGCPRCGGSDIDLAESARPKPPAPRPAGPVAGVDPQTRYGGYGPVGGSDFSR